MTTRANFSDASCSSIEIKSSWKASSVGVSCSAESQTPEEFFRFCEAETQSGRYTDIIQDQVTKKYSGMALLDYYASKHSYRTRDQWRKSIQQKLVTVDCEVCTEPDSKIDTEFFLEYVNLRSDAEVQTSLGSSERNEEDELSSRRMKSFLESASSVMCDELAANARSRAFDGYEVSEGDASDEISYWKHLTVDLEKKKVVYPDWANAKHFVGRISRFSLTRNKERIYDVEFEDGLRLSSVREEHIRLLVNISGKILCPPNVYSAMSEADKKAKLFNGVRVHTKLTFKNGDVKFVPGFIAKCNRSGTYDVECEGGRNEIGVPLEDLIVGGLPEGAVVEARKPSKVQLQCTGLSWNATGNTLAVSYGRTDVAGWCDFPGAVCLWNVFGKQFHAHDPDFVLDHAVGLMCVKCHPELPGLVAAGSFNGEVVVWDVSAPEAPIAVSPIFEYAHKEPVVNIEWAHCSGGGTWGPRRGEWVLISSGADGKILVWTLSNSLKNPIRGSTLVVGGKNSSKSSRRQFPLCHGATALSVSASANLASRSSVTSNAVPKWVILGQESGLVVRAPLNKLVGSSAASSTTDGELTMESFRTLPAVEEVYPPLKKHNEHYFTHEAHIGPVVSLQASPFHRNLFLTCGGDGSVKIFHLLEKSPLFQYEPTPPPGTPFTTSPFSGLTAASFSAIRPLVFAVTSADGFLYVFDLLSQPTGGPVATLEAFSSPQFPDASAGDQTQTTAAGGGESGLEDGHRRRHHARGSGGGGGAVGGLNRRVGLTGVTFNHKQRDLLAACDCNGAVHIWRLNWKLSNQATQEQAMLDQFAGHDIK